MTAIVRQLHEQGLVSSKPDPEDGRSAIVSLTAEGQTQFAVLAAAHRVWVGEALRHFPADRQEQLLELLTDLKSHLR